MMRAVCLPMMCVLALLSCVQGASAKGWHRDVQQAFQVAQAEQKPMLLFLTMNGCGYCTKMIQNTLTDETVRKTIGSSYVPAVVKASERPDLMRQLKVRSFPTTLLVNSQGQLLQQINGYVPANKLTHQLLKHAPTRDRSLVSQRPAPIVDSRTTRTQRNTMSR